MQKVQPWASIDLNRWLNPSFSDPNANIGLTPLRRCIRATLISSRNAVYFVAAMVAIRHLKELLPVYAFIFLALMATVGAYWQVLKRDRRDQKVSPGLLLVVFGLVFVLLAYFRSLADQAGFQARYDYVIGLDKALLGGNVPTVWLQQHLYSAGRTSPLDIYCTVVYLSYFTVPFVAGVALWHLRPRGFRLYLSASLVTMFLSAVWFTLVPTAPPWLAGIDGHLPQLTRIAALVIDNVRPGFYEHNYQVVGINDVAALPSLHIAQTTLVVLASWRYGRRLRILGSVYVASMGFSLVYLAEHYVSDILAGLLLGGFSWAVALRLTPSMCQAHEEHPLAAAPSTVVSESLRRAA
jgi:membrane-associated phospholipid phosphatase